VLSQQFQQVSHQVAATDRSALDQTDDDGQVGQGRRSDDDLGSENHCVEHELHVGWQFRGSCLRTLLQRARIGRLKFRRLIRRWA